MDETSDQQSGPPDLAGGESFSQEGSDALASGAHGAEGVGENEEAFAARAVSGEMGQAGLEAPTAGTNAAGAGGEASAAPPESREISQVEIDALMRGAGAAEQGPEASAETKEPGVVSRADIDALLNVGGVDESVATSEESGSEPEPEARPDSMGRPFGEGTTARQAAIEEKNTGAGAAAPMAAPPSPPPSETRPFDLPSFGAGLEAEATRVTMLNDVNLRVKLQLGQTRMYVEDVLKLGEGSVVELDKLAGDPVDVLVNERLIARGEVLVLNDVFCVRISEVLSNDPHRISV